MKNQILLIAAIAIAMNTNARDTGSIPKTKSHPVYSNDKSVSMYRSIDNSRFSVINPKWDVPAKTGAILKPETAVNATAPAAPKNCFKMVDDKMFVVKNGEAVHMDKYTTLKNGTVVMMNGVVITNSGKVVHLNNGDYIDMKGRLSCQQKAENLKEQAGL